MTDIEAQTVNDEGPAKKYFTVMLNMADDDLGPHEYRLLAHYIRVGECEESVRTTADKCKMNKTTIIRTRNALEESGWIEVKHRTGQSCCVTIIDRWAENISRYESVRKGGTPRKRTVRKGGKGLSEKRERTVRKEGNKEEPYKNKKNYITSYDVRGSFGVSLSYRPAPPSPKPESKPKRTPKQQRRDELFDAIIAVTGVDKKGNASWVGKTVNALLKFDPPVKPDEVRTTFMRWWRGNIRGRDGALPNPTDIQKFMGQARAKRQSRDIDLQGPSPAARADLEAELEKARQARQDGKGKDALPARVDSRPENVPGR